jgi:hypothetical protein
MQNHTPKAMLKVLSPEQMSTIKGGFSQEEIANMTEDELRAFTDINDTVAAGRIDINDTVAAGKISFIDTVAAF